MSKAIPCPITRDEFYNLYRVQNMSEGFLANMFSVSTTVIKSWRKMYDIDPKTKEEIAQMRVRSGSASGAVKYTSLTYELLYDLYIVQNKCPSEISEILCVPMDALKYYIKKYNLLKSKEDKVKSVDCWHLCKYGQNRKPRSDESYRRAADTRRKRILGGADCRSRIQRQNDENMNENSLRDDVFVMHLTNKEMAEKYHTSISSVKVRLNKFNIKRSRISITESQQRHKIPDAAYEILNDKDRFVSFLCEHKNLSAVDMAGLIGVEPNCIYKRAHQYGVRHIINRFSSSVEKSLCDFLLSIGVSSVKNRSLLGRLEVDCYCPDYKIGIEVNGTYWHSSIFKDKMYHYKKSLDAEAAGIRLIHIYEYEWSDVRTRPIIESMLRIAFGKVKSRIYARDCEVRIITNREARMFNEANHLQGHRNAQITYGLFYHGLLVQLMSFSKHKKYGWEIIRGCPGSNNIVIGGVSRLFKRFIKDQNPDSVFSYADFNKFDGSGYLNLGMKFIGYTGPDMRWIINGKVFSRNPFKHKEMKEASEAVLWGSGSKKFLWTKDNC